MQVFRIEDRNVGTALCIKFEFGDRRILSYRILYICKKQLPYSLLVSKLYLRLDRMDIYVNILRIHGEKDEIRNLFTRRNKPFHRLLNGFMEIRMLHESSVDEEELRCSALLGRLRFADISPYSAYRGLVLDRQERLVYLLSEEIHDSLQLGSGRKNHHRLSVLIEFKLDIRIDKCNSLKGLGDVFHLRLVTFEELSSCRHVVEEVFYIEITAWSTCYLLLTGHI